MSLDLFKLRGEVSIDVRDGERKLKLVDYQARKAKEGLDAAGTAAEKTGVKLNKAGGQARDAAGKFAASADRAGASARRMNADIGGSSSILQSFSSGLLALAGSSLTMVSAATAVVSIGSRTEDSLNTLQSVTRAGADEMERASKFAVALGNDLSLLGTSAADAADAMVELTKGGLSLQQSMDAARGTIQLARAATIQEGQAATITADALNTFGLAGDQATRVADLLAGSANASSGEITDMAQALSQAGAVARGAKVSIEDTVTVISLLAKNGIKGSDAGTSLKTFLLALQTPVSNEASDALAKLNVQAYDANKSFKLLPQLVGEFQRSLEGLNEQDKADALRKIFGADAIRAARIIFGEGTAGFNAMSAAVTRSGQAAEIAAAKSRGLSGAWDALKSTAETAAIGVYNLTSGPLTALLRMVAEYPGIFAAAAIAVGVLIAAHALYNSELLITAATRIPQLVSSMRNVITVMTSFSQVTKLSATGLATFALGWVGLAAAAAIAVASMIDWTSASERAASITKESVEALRQQSAGAEESLAVIRNLTTGQAGNAEEHKKLEAVLQTLNPTTRAYINTIGDEKEKLDTVKAAIDDLANRSHVELEARMQTVTSAILETNDAIAREEARIRSAQAGIGLWKQKLAEGSAAQDEASHFISVFSDEVGKANSLIRDDLTPQLEKNSATQILLADALRISRESFVRQLEAAGRTREQIAQLLTVYDAARNKNSGLAAALNTTTGAVDAQAAAVANLDAVMQRFNARDQGITARVMSIVDQAKSKADAVRMAREAMQSDPGFAGAVTGSIADKTEKEAVEKALGLSGASGGGGGGRGGARGGGRGRESVLDKLTDSYRQLSSQVRMFGQETAVARAEEELFQVTQGKGIEALRGATRAKAKDVLLMAAEVDRLAVAKKAEDERASTKERFVGLLEQQAERLRELAGGENAVTEMNRLLADPKVSATLDENTKALLRKNAALIVTAEKAKEVNDAFRQMGQDLDGAVADAELRLKTLGVDDPVKSLALQLAATDLPKGLDDKQYGEIIAKRLKLLEVTRRLAEQEKTLAADTSFKNQLDQISRAMLDVTDATAAQRLQYELTVGTLKDLTDAQKEALRAKSAELEGARTAKEALERQRDEMRRLADDLSGIVRHGAREGWRGMRDDFREMLLDMAQDYLRSQLYRLLTGDKSAQQGGGFNPLGALFDKVFNRDTSGATGGQKDNTPTAVRDAGTQAVSAVKGAGEAQAGAIETTGDATTRGLSGVSQTLLTGLAAVANQIAIGQQGTGFWKGLLMAGASGFVSGLLGGIKIGGGGPSPGAAGINGPAITPPVFGSPGLGSATPGTLGFASGGFISGPGTATSDSIAAFLSNGEFVMSASAVRRIGVSALQYMNTSGRMPQRFASGGYAGSVPVAAPARVEGRDSARPGSGGGGAPIINIHTTVKTDAQGRVRSSSQVQHEVYVTSSESARRNG